MKLFFALALLIIANGCTRKLYNKVPDCIQKKIAALQLEPKANPPASVEEYEYNGKKVFLFSSKCCDQYAELYDTNCNFICAPSGGITGKGDCKCTDFTANAKFIKLVWKDER